MATTDTITNDTFLNDFVENALREDVGSGDHTTLACIPTDHTSKAKLLVKDAGVIAGIEVARFIFNKVAPSTIFKSYFQDGQAVGFGDIIFEVDCNTHVLLKVERLILNTMQRMSGIATLSNRYKFEVEDLPVTILDTRKTTPLIRPLEKYAVRLGGCTNYRSGLYDWIMIKDNHIDACGSIKEAINRVEAYQKANHLNLNVTIEVRNLVELYQVLEIGKVTRILLDNFEIPILKEAVEIIGNRFETEASGGINIHNIRNYAKTGVQFVSVGSLTHSAVSLDLSLKVIKE